MRRSYNCEFSQSRLDTPTRPVEISEMPQSACHFEQASFAQREPALSEVEGNEGRPLDAREAMTMYPRLMPGATLLLDRHYNALKPYRKGDFNMYAVLKNDTCAVRYVEVAGSHLILRPHNQASPIEVLPVIEGKSATDYLVGRICQIGLEA